MQAWLCPDCNLRMDVLYSIILAVHDERHGLLSRKGDRRLKYIQTSFRTNCKPPFVRVVTTDTRILQYVTDDCCAQQTICTTTSSQH